MPKIRIAALSYDRARQIAEEKHLRRDEWDYLSCRGKLQGLTACVVFLDESAKFHPEADEIFHELKIRQTFHPGIRVIPTTKEKKP